MKHLSIVERHIIDAVLDDAQKLCLLVSVFDGEEWALKPSSDFGAARSVIGATDETTLRFRDPSKLDERGKPAAVGSVAFLHGNECDVIHDYSDNVETGLLVARALLISEKGFLNV